MKRPSVQCIVALLCCLLIVGGASGVGATAAQEEAPEAARSKRDGLRMAEVAFARTVALRDRTAFLASVADDAVFLSPNPLVGKEAIVKAWAPFFEAEGPTLEWEPEVVEVQPGGALGITHGPFRLTVRDADGKLQIRKGTFTSVWRYEAEGTWRVIFDSGCPCQPED